MIIYKMISAVSKNPINNYYCNYYWTMDYFTHIILPSEDHYCFSDMIGLIKSLGFGDWRMRLRPCRLPLSCLVTLSIVQNFLTPGADGRSLPLKTWQPQRRTHQDRLAPPPPMGNMKETQAQALKKQKEAAANYLPWCVRGGGCDLAGRPSCPSGWKCRHSLLINMVNATICPASQVPAE